MLPFLIEFRCGPLKVALREALESDRELLCRIYASTREEELAPVPWSAAQKEEFLRMQFGAQDAYYRQNYPGVEFYVILIDGAEAGRIYLHEGAKELRLMDIALLPSFQRQGVGGALIKAVQDRASAKGLNVGIHVESFNPAMRLYKRLGFVEVGNTQVYVAMEWKPGGPAAEPPSSEAV